MLNPVLSSDLRRHIREVNRELRAGRFERSGNGLLMPRMHAAIGGYFALRHDRRINGAGRYDPHGRYETIGQQRTDNLVVDTGRNQIAQNGLSAFVGYLAPYSTDIAPAAGQTSADVVATLGEFTNYDETTRRAWTKDAYASFTYVNAGSPALFTISTGGGTIWGNFLITTNTKEATTGTLLAVGQYGAARDLLAADLLYTQYGITLTAS